MFGTSGIRGIYGKEVTERLATAIANAFAQDALVVGRDLRRSGMSLRNAVADGALEAGADIIDAGIVPTPTLALSALRNGCRGIMITASHNPPQYNGLKLIEHGKEIGKGLEEEVVERHRHIRHSQEKGGFFFDCDAVEAHKALVMGRVDDKSIGRRRPKVLVDCNGAACAITPSLLTDLGCRVTSVNASFDCFNRASEPSARNLEYLSELVRRSGADFAIAHDGDGDRCAILDERGTMLPLDVQLAMMIEHEMASSDNRRIVSTVEASLTIRDVVQGNGGEIEITPVGSTYVGEALEQKDALFGGEPCGEYVYKDGVHVPDAVLAAAKFAEMFSAKGAFSEMASSYRQHFMAREKFPAEDKHAAMERIKAAISIEGKVRDDDGLRVDEEDGWFLVRASGTEPIIRLTMEYGTRERLEKREKELHDAIRRSL